MGGGYADVVWLVSAWVVGGVSAVEWVYRSAVRTAISGVALCVLVGGFGVGVGCSEVWAWAVLVLSKCGWVVVGGVRADGWMDW